MSVHKPFAHDSGHKHVAGSAEYIDDMPEPAGTLHAYLGLSEKAHARIAGMDFEAVLAAPGVVAVLTAADIPGVNDISSGGVDDETMLADGVVQYWGQPVFAVVAETRDQARRAAKKAKIAYEDLPALLDVDAALAANGKVVTEPLKLERGDFAKGLKDAPRRIKGTMALGGQDHFYLEGQISLAVPGEDDDVQVYASTQHPSEVQHIVGHVLGIPSNAVTVNVRRMGGGFGGKETQGNMFASVAALAARKLKRPIKIRPDRDDDMTATGKRHNFRIDYDFGFDDDGRFTAADVNFAAQCGYCSDLSGPVTDRALFHGDNTYYFPAVRFRSQPLKTNTVSNTAFRGFGGPQGMLGGERMIEEIAYALGKDPLDIRKANFYGTTDRNVTPYHQTVEDNIIHRVVDELEVSSDYRARREAIIAFNKTSRFIRRGIALTPVKFGISFTATWFNQAGALVHIYRDGSVHLNHGGTEMGQGLHIKVAQVAADALGVDLDKIKVTATTTGKVPNTSATAASSGADLNAMAALDACDQIKARLAAFVAEKHQTKPDDVRFSDGQVFVGERRIPLTEVVDAAYMERVHLSAGGFYKTPEIHWDRKAGKGKPFYYFAYGAAVSEVSIDTLTGEYRMERTDILHDAGKSLNPGVDMGQIEGGFVQGVGWLTTEELVWDDEGQLRTHAPSTYKIPLASDLPRIFNVKMAEWSENPARTIKRSKAVGEPPFMLAMSAFEALSMAVASIADYRICPRLDAPATPERILMTVERLKREARDG